MNDLHKRILLDLTRAKNLIPRQYRRYHIGGRYRGVNGAPFDDTRQKGYTLVNQQGQVYHAVRREVTHKGEQTLTLSAYNQIDRQALGKEVRDLVKKIGDEIERCDKPLEDKQRMWEAVQAGHQMVDKAIFSMLPNNTTGRLYIARDSNQVIKGVGYAHETDHGVYLDYLGAVGTSGSGAGSMILKEVMGWCKALGKEEVELDPVPTATTFYEKHGFTGDKTYRCELKFTELNVPETPA